jgi:hypothetical protein
VTAVLDTVRGLSRSIAVPDAHALSPASGMLRQQVAANLAWQFARHLYRGVVKSRRRIGRRDVAVALASHGATALTIELHAHAIAAIIRADYSDGGAATC